VSTIDPRVGDADSVPVVSGRTHTAARVVLATIAVVVTLGSLVSLGVVAIGLGSIRIVTESRALPTDMRLLSIDTGDVPAVVRVVTDADAREPRIDLRMVTRGQTQLNVADDAADSRVTLSDNGSGFLWFDRSGEIRVILPPDVARDLSVKVNEQARPITT